MWSKHSQPLTTQSSDQRHCIKAWAWLTGAQFLRVPSRDLIGCRWNEGLLPYQMECQHGQSRIRKITDYISPSGSVFPFFFFFGEGGVLHAIFIFLCQAFFKMSRFYCFLKSLKKQHTKYWSSRTHYIMMVEKIGNKNKIFKILQSDFGIKNTWRNLKEKIFW